MTTGSPPVPAVIDCGLEAGHFQAPLERALFVALLWLGERNWPITPGTVAERLRCAGFENSAAAQHVEELFALTAEDPALEQTALMLRQQHAETQLTAAIANLESEARQPDRSLERIRSAADRLVVAAGAASGRGGTPLPLLSAGEVATLPAPRWLIEDVLPDEGVTVLYGAPGVGKSFLALDWALSLSSGRDWLGRRTIGKRPVLYFAGEGLGGYGPRVRAWLDTNQHVDAGHCFMVPASVDLLDATSIAAIRGTISRLRGSNPVLVFDTLARSWAGGDENSARDMGLLVSAVEDLRRSFSLSVLIVHHCGRTGDGERGSTALRGAADAMLLMKRSKTGALELRNTKSRNSARPQNLRLALRPTGESCVVDTKGPEEPGAASDDQDDGALDDNDQVVLSALQRLEREGRTPATSGDLQKASGLSESSYARARRELERRELVFGATVGKNRLFSLAVPASDD